MLEYHLFHLASAHLIDLKNLFKLVIHPGYEGSDIHKKNT